MNMPVVTIWERCIVGEGSVVTKNVSDSYMVAGNPERFIGFTDRSLKNRHVQVRVK